MTTEKNILQNNIIKLRELIGLSQEDFAMVCGFSRTTLSNIESKSILPTSKTLQKISEFTRIDSEELSKSSFNPSIHLREKLQKVYSKDLTKKVILNKTPSVPHIIICKMIPSGFFDKDRERKEIHQFIEEQYKWKIRANTLTKVLRRSSEYITATPHPTKKLGFVYKKKFEETD